MIQLLDDIERRIEDKLSAEYAQAKAINNSVTSLLLSASKVVENRDRYLGKVGITDEGVTSVIGTVNDAVGNLLAAAKETEKVVSRTEAYLTTLEDVKKSLE